jgi:dihydropteroate synthase-like protein
MRVIAEIVNAPTLKLDNIQSRALYFLEQEADIIDIGMLAHNPQPEKIGGIISAIREVSNLPLSIDTLDPLEIKAAIDANIDLILSIDAGNILEVAPLVGDTAAVVLPTNMKEGYLPKKPEKRVEMMHRNIELARENGAEKLIADLIVEPLLKPGLMNSLESFRLFHEQSPKIPLLFGMGNVTELIDADSTGVNAAIASLAAEVGSNMLHIPEHSVKARGGVQEAVKASRMMWIASRRGSLPKDLGVDLLVLKEKRWKEEQYNRCLEDSVNIIFGVPEEGFNPDWKGYFKVHVDREKGELVALHFPVGENQPDIIIKGRNSRKVYKTIIREELVSKLDHAAYLGKELEKAYIALKLGRSYVQDKPLFN